MDPAQQQMEQYQQQQAMVDASHLRLLAIFHYVFGGLSVLGGIFMIGYIFLMRSLMGAAASSGSGAAPPEMDQMMTFIGIIYAVFGVIAFILAICNFCCGKFLTERKNRTFIMIISGINCLSIPLGTTLGVFTFIVLLRSSVTNEFNSGKPH